MSREEIIERLRSIWICLYNELRNEESDALLGAIELLKEQEQESVQ